MNLKNLIAIGLSMLAAGAAHAQPPNLVTTSPQFWAIGVNAATQHSVSVSFDQPMRPGFVDWFGRDQLSPPSTLKTVASADRTTMTVDVKLAPGKVYVMALNGRGIPGVGFQNEKGLSLPPTFLVFQTAGTAAPDDAPPRVTATVPMLNATEVDPAKLKSMTVTFDRPMNTTKHGLHLTENNVAVDVSKARFQYSADGKTFAIAYDFKPSAAYDIELNNTHDIGFTSAKRVPSWPARASFTTGQTK